MCERRRKAKFEEDFPKVVVGHPVIGLLLIQEDQGAFYLIFSCIGQDGFNRQGDIRSRPSTHKAGLVRMKEAREDTGQPIGQDP
jgi:hypothetical protein